MRENRTYGSEGGEPGSTGLPYPYQTGGLRTCAGELDLAVGFVGGDGDRGGEVEAADVVAGGDSKGLFRVGLGQGFR